jgi:hypothetical protein
MQQRENNSIYTERFHKLLLLIELNRLLKEATRTLASETYKNQLIANFYRKPTSLNNLCHFPSYRKLISHEAFYSRIKY